METPPWNMIGLAQSVFYFILWIFYRFGVCFTQIDLNLVSIFIFLTVLFPSGDANPPMASLLRGGVGGGSTSSYSTVPLFESAVTPTNNAPRMTLARLSYHPRFSGVRGYLKGGIRVWCYSRARGKLKPLRPQRFRQRGAPSVK